jgi:hypothetical protein
MEAALNEVNRLKQLDYKVFATLEGIRKHCKTLAGIHDVIRARCGYRGQLEEFVILHGQLHLTSGGGVYRITWDDKDPQAFLGHKLKDVMTFDSYYDLCMKRHKMKEGGSVHGTGSTSDWHIAPVDGSCEMCGGPWTLDNCLDCVQVGALAEGMAPRHYHPKCWDNASFLLQHARWRALFEQAGINHGALTPLADKDRPEHCWGPWFSLRTWMGTLKVGPGRQDFNIDWTDSKFRLTGGKIESSIESSPTSASFHYEHDFVRFLTKLNGWLQEIHAQEKRRELAA